MSKKLLLLGLVVIGGCGGGNAFNIPTTNPFQGTLKDSNSVVYASALRAMVEMTQTNFMLLSLGDLFSLYGLNGLCSTSGSAQGPYQSTYQTCTSVPSRFLGHPGHTYCEHHTLDHVSEHLNQCQRKFPDYGSYTGVYVESGSVTGRQKKNAAMTIQSPIAFAGFSLSPSISYQIGSAQIQGSDLTDSLGQETITLTGGTAVFLAGVNSSYQISQVNLVLTYSATKIQLSSVSPPVSAQFVGHSWQVNKGKNIYFVDEIQPVTWVPRTNLLNFNYYPISGQFNIVNGTTRCSPLVLTYLKASQFSLSCEGMTIVKNWTDSDVSAALTASIK